MSFSVINYDDRRRREKGGCERVEKRFQFNLSSQIYNFSGLPSLLTSQQRSQAQLSYCGTMRYLSTPLIHCPIVWIALFPLTCVSVLFAHRHFIYSLHSTLWNPFFFSVMSVEGEGASLQANIYAARERRRRARAKE